MVISSKKKFICVSIGKTATTSMEHVLKKYEDEAPRVRYKKHAPFYEIEDQYPLDQYFKFSFVRNPWAWAVSKYEFCKISPVRYRKWRGSPQTRRGRNPGCSPMPFNTVCENAKKYSFNEWIAIPGMVYVQHEYPIKTMLDHLTSKDKKTMLADKVFKFEEIKESYKEICDMLNIRGRLPHRRKRPTNTHYREYYNEKSREIIKNHFKKEIEMFDYAY